jgi:hypothetical protein
MAETGRNIDDWLTVYRSITLVDLQLEAQNSYLFTYNTFINSSTCFEHYPAFLQEVHVVTVYMQSPVSSLSALCAPVNKKLLRKSSLLTGAQDSHLQRVTIPEAAYIQ